MWQEHRAKRIAANQGQSPISSPWKHILYMDFLLFEKIHPFMFEPVELEFIVINCLILHTQKSENAQCSVAWVAPILSQRIHQLV